MRAAEALSPRRKPYESRCTITAMGELSIRVCLWRPPSLQHGKRGKCCPVSLLVWAKQGFWLFIVGSDLACCLVLSLAPVLKGQDLSVSSYCIHDGTKHSADCGNATQFLLSSSLVMGFKTQPVGMLLLFPCHLLHPLLVICLSVCLSVLHPLWSS